MNENDEEDNEKLFNEYTEMPDNIGENSKNLLYKPSKSSFDRWT
jgi:hypothetical protein